MSEESEIKNEQEEGEIHTGHIYMRSGNFFPFAARHLEWSVENLEIVSVKADFVSTDSIPYPAYVDWRGVEAILFDSEGSVHKKDG